MKRRPDWKRTPGSSALFSTTRAGRSDTCLRVYTLTADPLLIVEMSGFFSVKTRAFDRLPPGVNLYVS